LVTVVVGLSLTTAIFKVIDDKAALIPISRTHIWIFLVFIVTAIPFYHGAVRHLYGTYVEGGGSHRIKNGALVLDFMILFAESSLLVGLAYLIREPIAFLGLFMILMLVDSIWGFLAHTTLTGAQAQEAEKSWAIINVIYFVILLVGYFSFNVGGDSFLWSDRFSYILLGTAFLRMIADYYFAWDFYFPSSPPKAPG
jgi:hypothetical protein